MRDRRGMDSYKAPVTDRAAIRGRRSTLPRLRQNLGLLALMGLCAMHCWEFAHQVAPPGRGPWNYHFGIVSLRLPRSSPSAMATGTRPKLQHATTSTRVPQTRSLWSIPVLAAAVSIRSERLLAKLKGAQVLRRRPTTLPLVGPWLFERRNPIWLRF